MPLPGVGFLRVRECSEEDWNRILNEIEVVLVKNSYDKGYPCSEYVDKDELIKYTKTLKTIEQAKKADFVIEKPEDCIGMELGAIYMSIEYDSILNIPNKIKFEPPYWCKSDMRMIDYLISILAKTNLFKLVYYCSFENEDFVTDAEEKQREEANINIALLTDPTLCRKIINLANSFS